MNKLNTKDQDLYNVLQSKKLKASSGEGEPLSESETTEFKRLTEIIKPSSVQNEADAKLTPGEQYLYNVLQSKKLKASSGEGESLSESETTEFKRLTEIVNKKKKDDGRYGGRRSKKRPTARRRRSSKRKARKSRITRRR